ncbi:hypothetical protein O3M35_011623 [Rhynocoris fuscipes]|uniref:Uncharacterized protein n=1 Tax=Rhynocoris fuscipes TaxID=488301 RepID=A0AAW1CZJ7_9HEMI
MISFVGCQTGFGLRSFSMAFERQQGSGNQHMTSISSLRVKKAASIEAINPRGSNIHLFKKWLYGRWTNCETDLTLEGVCHYWLTQTLLICAFNVILTLTARIVQNLEGKLEDSI